MLKNLDFEPKIHEKFMSKKYQIFGNFQNETI